MSASARRNSEDGRPIEVDERDAHAELSGENASRVINESNKLNIQIHTDHYSNTSKQWQGHTKRKIVWKMAHWEVRAVILLDSETITWHIGYRRPRIESSGFMSFCWDVVVSCPSPAGEGVFIIHSAPPPIEQRCLWVGAMSRVRPMGWPGSNSLFCRRETKSRGAKVSENADPEPIVYQYDGASELELNLIREFERVGRSTQGHRRRPVDREGVRAADRRVAARHEKTPAQSDGQSIIDRVRVPFGCLARPRSKDS